ncbi:TetR/AcrR family transcriptional regulator, partial [Bradyrhizobium sp.]
LKVLARHGFAALKADRLAKTMGVSRGSFYWHFADIAAFHGAILKHWREVAAEQVIADLEAGEAGEDPLARLLTRVLSERLTLEKAVRSWASFDAAARAAVQAIDRRRLGYLETMLKRSGLAPEAAQVRAQLLYWTFLGVTFSDKPPPDDIRQALLDELLRFARS